MFDIEQKALAQCKGCYQRALVRRDALADISRFSRRYQRTYRHTSYQRSADALMKRIQSAGLTCYIDEKSMLFITA